MGKYVVWIASASLVLNVVVLVLLLSLSTAMASMADDVQTVRASVGKVEAEVRSNYFGSNPRTLRQVVDDIANDTQGLTP